MLQEEWGCAGAGCASRELNPDFAREVRHVATLIGADPSALPQTCPFATIQRADEITLELTEAFCAMGIDGGFDPAAYGMLLGRTPTHVDVEAYKVWRRALAESQASDRAFAEKARKKA